MVLSSEINRWLFNLVSTSEHHLIVGLKWCSRAGFDVTAATKCESCCFASFKQGKTGSSRRPLPLQARIVRSPVSLCWRCGHRVQADGRLDGGRLFQTGFPTLLLPPAPTTHLFSFLISAAPRVVSLSLVHHTYFSRIALSSLASVKRCSLTCEPSRMASAPFQPRLRRELWNYRATLVFCSADTRDCLSVWVFNAAVVTALRHRQTHSHNKKLLNACIEQHWEIK